jgi:hypothetical protein
LEACSLVGTSGGHRGLYKSSHTLFADGEQIKQGDSVLAASTYVFLNTQPYARPSAGRGCEAVAVLAQQRFGNQAKFRSASSRRRPAVSSIGRSHRWRQLAERHGGGQRELKDW